MTTLLSKGRTQSIEALDIHRVLASLRMTTQWELTQEGILKNTGWDQSIRSGQFNSSSLGMGLSLGTIQIDHTKMLDLYQLLTQKVAQTDEDNTAQKEVTLVLDTNVFMHFKRPDQFTWSEFLNKCSEEAPEHVIWYIPIILLLEIGEIKDKQDGKAKRKRAKDIDRWFGQLAEDEPEELPNGLGIEFQMFETHNTYKQFRGHEPQNGDAKFISACMELQAQGRRVIFIGHDTGTQVTAKAVQIPFLRPPEDWKLPVELSPVEQELKKVKHELNQLKMRQPKLHAGFQNKEKYVEVVSHFEILTEEEQWPPLESSEDIQNRITEAKRELNQIQKNIHNNLMFAFPALTPPSEEELEDYLEKLDCYAVEYEAFRQERESMNDQMKKNFSIHFLFSNQGTCPAHNVRFRMHIQQSSQVKFLDQQQSYDCGNEPPFPKRPQGVSALSLMSDCQALEQTRAYLHAHLSVQDGSESELEPSTPQWRMDIKQEDECWIVEYRLDRIQHHETLESPSLICHVKNPEELNGFSINVSCLCDELPKPIKTKLSVKFKTA